MEGYELTINAKSGPEGKLFGSLGTIDIADALVAAGHEVERSEVRLPDGPLRATGDYEIELHLHADVNVAIKVIVVGEQDEAQAAIMAEIEAEDAAPEAEQAADESSEESKQENTDNE